MGSPVKKDDIGQNKSLHSKDLSGVLESGMCIACGACVAADPGLSLRLNPKTLIFEPDGAGSEKAARVCPAVSVDYEGLQKKIFPDAEITEHGVVEDVFLAQSTDYQRNLRASSGGMIKELMREFLSNEEIDGVIGLKHGGGLEFSPQIIRSEEEVDTLPGSIYHNIPLDNALKILKEEAGRFVLVGIPCQLEGIYNYIFNVEPELRQKIHTTVGLVCGWNYSHHSLKAICDFKNLDYDSITDISYRGGGPVGKLRITSDSKKAEINRRVDFSYQVAFDRSFNIPRCHVCINHTNFMADIVVGDAWLPSTVGTKTGISIVICRKSSSIELLKTLEEKGSINLSKVSPEEITESQSHHITFGDFAYAYQDYLHQEGIPAPVLEGPNRVRAKLAPREKVASFHREYTLKRQLQQQGRYKRLWWRKCTLELRKFLMKYIRWFVVRVLKIKTLFGVRSEVPKEKLSGFR